MIELTCSQDKEAGSMRWSNLSTQLLECETSQEVSKVGLTGFRTGLRRMCSFGMWTVLTEGNGDPAGPVETSAQPLLAASKNLN